MNIFPKWFDEYNLLHPDPIPATSNNGILHLAYYIMLKDDKGEEVEFTREEIARTLRAHYCKDFTLRQSPWHYRKMSHDNFTAYLYLVKRFDLEPASIEYPTYDFRLGHVPYSPIIGHYWHPARVIYFLRVKYGHWFTPLMFIPFIAAVLTCQKTYEDYDKTLLHSDGKLLMRLKWSTVSMPITKWVCELILENKLGAHCWHFLFCTYFRVKGHPCRILSK